MSLLSLSFHIRCLSTFFVDTLWITCLSTFFIPDHPYFIFSSSQNAWSLLEILLVIGGTQGDCKGKIKLFHPRTLSSVSWQRRDTATFALPVSHLLFLVLLLISCVQVMAWLGNPVVYPPQEIHFYPPYIGLEEWKNNPKVSKYDKSNKDQTLIFKHGNFPSSCDMS